MSSDDHYFRSFLELTAELELLIPDSQARLNPGFFVEDNQLPLHLRLLYQWRNGQRPTDSGHFREWRSGNSSFNDNDVILPFFFLSYQASRFEYLNLDPRIRDLLGETVFLIGIGYTSGLVFAAESNSGSLAIGSLCEDGTIMAEHDGLLNMLQTWIEAWRLHDSHWNVAKKFSPRCGTFWDSIDDWINAAP